LKRRFGCGQTVKRFVLRTGKVINLPFAGFPIGENARFSALPYYIKFLSHILPSVKFPTPGMIAQAVAWPATTGTKPVNYDRYLANVKICRVIWQGVPPGILYMPGGPLHAARTAGCGICHLGALRIFPQSNRLDCILTLYKKATNNERTDP
jgi:hypothetical protein